MLQLSSHSLSTVRQDYYRRQEISRMGKFPATEGAIPKFIYDEIYIHLWAVVHVALVIYDSLYPAEALWMEIRELGIETSIIMTCLCNCNFPHSNNVLSLNKYCRSVFRLHHNSSRMADVDYPQQKDISQSLKPSSIKVISPWFDPPIRNDAIFQHIKVHTIFISLT